MSLNKDQIITSEFYGGKKDITSRKSMESLSEDVMKAIKLVTVNPESFIPFGSFFSSWLLYYSDIDITSIIEVCCSREEAIEKMAEELQKMVKKIDKSKGYYYSELKCGFDDEYNIDIGYIKNNKIIGFNKKKVEKDIEELVNKNYFEKDDIIEIKKILKQKINPNLYEELYVILRKYFILRWTKEEVINGIKKLRGNREITLEEACSSKTMIKIDIWAPINGKYIEVTDFFVLAYKEKPDSPRILVNFDQDFLDTFVKGIKKEISKLYFSNYYFNPLKMLKRMWSLARYRKDYTILYVITPFLRSEVGLLGQIKSELETIQLMIERLRKPPLAKLINQVDSMRNRLANVVEVDFDEKLVDETIKKLVETYKKINKKTIIEILESIKRYLSKIINKYAINFIHEHNYPPRDYLPEEIILYGAKIDFLYPLKKAYQVAGNAYRKRFCDGKARPLEYGEIHPLCANYEGPGTRIDLYPNYPPYNNVDNAARTHDLVYSKNQGNPEMIRKADEDFIKAIEPYGNEQPYYSLGKLGIEGKMKAENILPYLTKLIAGPKYFGKK